MKVVDTLCSSADRCRGDDDVDINASRLNERVRGRRRKELRKRSGLNIQNGGKPRRFIGKQSEKNGEDECASDEIRDYLSKLHEIVPVSRKHKRLSRLQVLTNAIDYIRQLRETLGLPPCISSPEQQDPHLSSYSYSLPTSQSHHTNDYRSQEECHSKSQAHVWLVSMSCSPSHHLDNESSTPSHPAIP